MPDRTIPKNGRTVYPKEGGGPTNCFSGSWDFYHGSPTCYWGNLNFRSHWFNISSKQFTDTNAKYNINISKTKNGKFEIDNLEAKRQKGDCWYSTIIWEAQWVNNDHYEITLTDNRIGTGLEADKNYKCPDKK